MEFGEMLPPQKHAIFLQMHKFRFLVQTGHPAALPTVPQAPDAPVRADTKKIEGFGFNKYFWTLYIANIICWAFNK